MLQHASTSALLILERHLQPPTARLRTMIYLVMTSCVSDTYPLSKFLSKEAHEVNSQVLAP